MKSDVSKTNQGSDFFNRRLDEIRMSGHERLKAKARFAQAEAVAEGVSVAIRWMARQFKRIGAKPAGRAAPSAG